MVKFNPQLKQDITRYYDYTILVEGQKDVVALNELGFHKVHAIHQTSVSLKESLINIVEKLPKKEPVCILTDFDKKGKQLYLKIKEELSQLPGIKLDSTLRGILLKMRISHIEGLSSFMEKVDLIG